jgi:hypothetical protein
MTDTTNNTDTVPNPFSAPQIEVDMSIIKSHVDRLFRENPPRGGRLCLNPVTGGRYVGGLDPIEPQKRMARDALRAREWFAIVGPKDMQPLPISDEEIEDRKYAWDSKQPSLSYILSCFGYSLWACDYNYNIHPSFEDFACGVMASEHAPDFVKKDELLRKRYAPRHLPGLNAGHCWEPPAGQYDLPKRRHGSMFRAAKMRKPREIIPLYEEYKALRAAYKAADKAERVALRAERAALKECAPGMALVRQPSWQATDAARLVRRMRPMRPVKPRTTHFEDCLIATLREGLVVSFFAKLETAKAELTARNVDPWQLPLERVRGKTDYDGLERVSSQTLLDMLQVPQRSRRAPVYRRVAKLMAELGWTAVRVRDLTCGGYKEQVRGYCRDSRHSTVPNRERAPADSALAR